MLEVKLNWEVLNFGHKLCKEMDTYQQIRRIAILLIGQRLSLVIAMVVYIKEIEKLLLFTKEKNYILEVALLLDRILNG
jgi:hypothetical protein